MRLGEGLLRGRIPRAANLAFQAVALPALLVGAPLALARRGERHGWSAGRPGRANLVGVIPLGAGAAVLLWAVSSHYRAAPHGWAVRSTPDYLLADGPYRYSRNPMYVGEAAIWAGWTVLFGSLPVAAGLVALVAVQDGAVRWEEHALHRRWGDAYDDYRGQVPRCFGLPRRPAHQDATDRAPLGRGLPSGGGRPAVAEAGKDPTEP